MSEPDEIDDDALAELLADRLVELASRPGVLRLAALQMAGLTRPAGEISYRELGQHLGISRTRIHQLSSRALLTLRTRIQP